MPFFRLIGFFSVPFPVRIFYSSLSTSEWAVWIELETSRHGLFFACWSSSCVLFSVIFVICMLCAGEKRWNRWHIWGNCEALRQQTTIVPITMTALPGVDAAELHSVESCQLFDGTSSNFLNVHYDGPKCQKHIHNIDLIDLLLTCLARWNDEKRREKKVISKTRNSSRRWKLMF